MSCNLCGTALNENNRCSDGRICTVCYDRAIERASTLPIFPIYNDALIITAAHMGHT